MPSIPFPRLLLRFFSVLFPFVVKGWCNNSNSHNASVSSTVNDSQHFSSEPLEVSSENQNRDELRLPNITESKLYPLHKTKMKQNNRNRSKSKVFCLTDFDKLRNLFPEIPVSFRSEKIKMYHGSNLEAERINNGKQEKQKVRDCFHDTDDSDDLLTNLYSNDNGEIHVKKREYRSDSSQDESNDEKHLEVDNSRIDSGNRKYDSTGLLDDSHKNEEILGSNKKNCKSNIRNEDYHNKNDIGNNNNSRVEKDEEKELVIGFAELWLSCLKALVNLSHNCALASSILMGQDDNGIYKNYENDYIHTNIDKNGMKKLKSDILMAEDENGRTNNLMVVCCAALSICISKRNEMELEQKLKCTANENLDCNSRIDLRSPRLQKKSNEGDQHVSDASPHKCYSSLDRTSGKSDNRRFASVQDMGTLSPGETVTEVC